jgi:hypothetical protein
MLCGKPDAADRHPAVCRSLRRIGRQRDVRESAFNERAEAESVTVARERGRRWRGFRSPPLISSRCRTGENWKKNQLLCPRQGRGLKPCPESAKNCHGRDVQIFPGSGNFSQSPANQFGGATKLCWRNGAMDGASAAVAEPVAWGLGQASLSACGSFPLAESLARGRVDFTRRASTQAESSPASAEWSQ